MCTSNNRVNRTEALGNLKISGNANLTVCIAHIMQLQLPTIVTTITTLNYKQPHQICVQSKYLCKYTLT